MASQISKLMLALLFLSIVQSSKYQIIQSNNQIEEESEYLQGAIFFNHAKKIAIQSSKAIQILSIPEFDLLHTIELENSPWKLYLHPKDNRIFVVLVTGKVAIYDGNSYEFQTNLEIEEIFLSLVIEFDLKRQKVIVGGMQITGSLEIKKFNLIDFKHENTALTPIKNCRLDSMTIDNSSSHLAALCEPRGKKQILSILSLSDFMWIKEDIVVDSGILCEITGVKFGKLNELLYLSCQNESNYFMNTLDFNNQNSLFFVTKEIHPLFPNQLFSKIHSLSQDVLAVSIGKELILMDALKLNILYKKSFQIEIVSIDSTVDKQFLLIAFSNNTHSEVFLEKLISSNDFSLRKEGPKIELQNYKEIEVSGEYVLKVLGMILMVSFVNAFLLVVCILINYRINLCEKEAKTGETFEKQLNLIWIMANFRSNRTP